jgi:hypothetical protein
MGDQDAGMLSLDHQHPVVCAQRVIAVTLTRRHRQEEQQLLQHRLWSRYVRAEVIHPAFERCLGNRTQKQRGQEERTGSAADAAAYREGAGAPAHAFAHMRGGRDPLDGRCTVHTLVLVVEVGAWRDAQSILERMVERRECMPIDVVGLWTPTDRRSRPSRILPVALASLTLHNRRAVFAARAPKGVLVEFGDHRRTLPLPGDCPRLPFAAVDVPWALWQRG